jgi:D-alanyl-lipoteichoic acid acyltransferase DltB (MBOAT superfamily)
MLFNSYQFVLLFLPLVLLVFFRIGALGRHRIAISWLVAASLFFYGWWNPAYLGLIIASMLFNYAVGAWLGSNGTHPASRKTVLVFGIVVNLGLIAYFKYANFLVDNLNRITGLDYQLDTIVLPLAISFFTFQQITFLVDAWRGETSEYNFLHYCLFVTFFPQLIAGPIVHHKEMLPQFAKNSIYRFRHEHFSVGVTIFFIGLFKKVVLADSIAVFSTPAFDAASHGVELTFLEAWGGALAYTLQLYFDFSGYSDMAIGLARMFGIRLPLNFHSPYKATSIIEFWRRWHMTLSRFLRDYVYIPLGGSRAGKPRRYSNLLITMLIGGLWHGAGWTFIVWGGLHGLYLIVNHMWRWARQKVRWRTGNPSIWGKWLARFVTFLAVVVAWVFFRADSFDAAEKMLLAMSGINGVVLPETYQGYLKAYLSLDTWALEHGIEFGPMKYYAGIKQPIYIAILLVIAWAFPNTQQIMSRYNPSLYIYEDKHGDYHASWLQWSPVVRWALLIAILAVWSLIEMNEVSEFLYYQF